MLQEGTKFLKSQIILPMLRERRWYSAEKRYGGNLEKEFYDIEMVPMHEKQRLDDQNEGRQS